MNTPAISNLINALTSGTPAAKQSGASSDTQFNRMLSRGIEERRNQAGPREAESNKPIANENTPAKQAQSSQSSAKTNKTGSSEEGKATSADEEATAPAAQDAATPVEQAKARSDVDAGSEDEEAALAASSDELLALVANLTQAGPLPTGTSADAPVDDTTQAALADVDVDVDVHADAAAAAAAALGAKTAGLTSAADSSVTDLAPVVGKGDVTAQATLTQLRNRAASEAATSEEPGAAIEFDASLAQAKDRKGAADAKAALVQSQSGENQPAAATQSGAELHAAKAAVHTQPVATPVASINVAPHSQVAIQQVQAAASAATDKLTPRVGSNGWDQALGQKVVWMVAGELQSASLTLNPPDLGPLEVVLNVSNSQATVNFTAAQPEVRQALEDAVPKLREMLGDAGIQLGQANVSAGTPNNQQGGFGDRRQASRGTGQKMDDSGDAPVRTVRSQTITGGGQGLVDTFA